MCVANGFAVLGVKHKTQPKMRQRINPAAVCSSSNYYASKRVHRKYLEEKHREFILSGFDKIPATPKSVVITVFGKPMRVSYSDYVNHNLQALGF